MKPKNDKLRTDCQNHNESVEKLLDICGSPSKTKTLIKKEQLIMLEALK